MGLNHLLYMDDLKLFTRNEVTFSKLLQATEAFFAKIDFGLNTSKSVRTECYEGISQELEKLLVVNLVTGYKYLGFFQVDKTNQYGIKKKVLGLVQLQVVK